MIIDLAGNLTSRANQFLQSMQRFGNGSTRSMQMLSRSLHVVGQGLDKLGNRYTALLTGAAGVGAVKQVGDLSQRFAYLGIQANASAGQMDALKRKIFEVSQAPDIRVDPGEITAAIEDIVEKTGDLKFAQENIRNIGLAIRATGAEGGNIGAIMSEFQKMGITNSQQVMEAIDILNVQGKAGAFTLQNLASLGPRVVTAYTSMGRGGVGAIREMGAALQVIRMGTGTSEMAATAFEAVMRTLGNAKKVEMLQAGGIQVFDVEELKKGKEVLRPINQLMVEIIKKTKGKKTLLSEVFDEEAIRAFNAAAGEFKRTGSVESLDRFMHVQADGSTTMKDSARAAKEFNAAVTSLGTAWKQFASDNLTKPVQTLADTLNSLKPETVQRWLKIGTAIGVAVGALVAARKAWGVYETGRDALRYIRTGKKGGIPGLGGGLGGAAGGAPIPVYVVNQPAGLLDGKPGGGILDQYGNPIGKSTPGAGAAAKVAPGIIKTTLAAGGYAAIPAALAGGVGYGSRSLGAYMAANEARHSSSQSLQELRSRQMVMGGGANSFQVQTIDKELAKRGFNVGGTIKIEIAADGRARVREIKSDNEQVKFNVDNGMMMAGH